jgi:ribonuclease P protein subunit RPR2
MKFRDKSKEKKVARERIIELFKQADAVFDSDKALANHYVDLARKYAMKYKVRIPSELQKKFCKHCYSYLKPGKNLRVRTQQSKVVYSCLECKKFMRFPYKKK